MNQSKLGISYILWIFTAWSFVALTKFCLYSHLILLDETTSIIAKEFVRLLVFLGPVLFFILCNLNEPWYRWLGLYGCNKGSLYKTIIVSAVYAMVSVCVNIYLFHKTAHFLSIPASFWFTTFSSSIIVEEIAFRGFLFYLFRKWNKNKIVIVTSLAFVLKHVPGWIFFPTEISVSGFVGDSIMVFAVGYILGYLYLKTHSIWATSLVHAINNFIVALFN